MQALRGGYRPELRYQNTANDERRAGERPRAKALAQKKQRGEPGKDRLQREDERRVRRRKMLLRPALDGEGCRRRQHAGDGKGKEEARRGVEERAASDGQGQQHEKGSHSDLDRPESAGAGKTRGVTEGE